MPRAYRVMKAEGEPLRPVIGDAATKLGVRARDLAPDNEGNAQPGQGGMSVISSVSYSMWLKRILDVHTAQSWDMESTEVRELEEEELNDLWTEIDDSQKERLWGLSSDLNSLRDRETWVESDWPLMTKEGLERAQAEAFQRNRCGGRRAGVATGPGSVIRRV